MYVVVERWMCRVHMQNEDDIQVCVSVKVALSLLRCFDLIYDSDMPHK